MKSSRNEWTIFCNVDDEIALGYIKDIRTTISRHRTSDYLCYGGFSLGDKDKIEREVPNPEVNINMIISSKGIDNSSDYLMF